MLNWLRLVFARVWRMWAVGVAIGLLSGLVGGWVRRDAVAGLNVALYWVMIGLSAIALVSLVYIDLQGRSRRLYRDRNEAYALTLIVGLLGGAGSIALCEALNNQVSALLFGGGAALISAALSGADWTARRDHRPCVASGDGHRCGALGASDGLAEISPKIPWLRQGIFGDD
ncbi:MAG: hypothetical protein IPO29_06555 [Anaerolineae bacterium]|nr:hypothetical protein [Anaerolineae bacterium]